MTARQAPADQLAETVYTALYDDAEARVCKDIPESACAHLPRNFVFSAIALALTKSGDRLVDPKLTLAWLISSLGAPGFLIGLIAPVREAGSLLPQLFIARWIRERERRKFVWAGGAVGQALALFAMAGAALVLEDEAAGWALIGLLALFALARAFCSVSHKDVLGKTVSKTRRGAVSGYASSLSGLAALGFGAVLILAPETEPSVIALILAAGGVLWVLAAFAYLQLAEAPGATAGGANAFTEAIGQLALLKTDPDFARFVLARAFYMATSLLPPFFRGLRPVAYGNGSRRAWRFSDRVQRRRFRQRLGLGALGGQVRALGAGGGGRHGGARLRDGRRRGARRLGHGRQHLVSRHRPLPPRLRPSGRAAGAGDLCGGLGHAGDAGGLHRRVQHGDRGVAAGVRGAGGHGVRRLRSRGHRRARRDVPHRVGTGAEPEACVRLILMRINDAITIDERLIEERFVRASGPGGQHVNTTSSAVQLRFNLAASDLPGPVKERLTRLAGSRLSADGILVLHASAHRSQMRNREEARVRLRMLILQASRKPKARKPTRPTLASIKRQKTAKAKRSTVKALRAKPGEE